MALRVAQSFSVSVHDTATKKKSWEKFLNAASISPYFPALPEAIFDLFLLPAFRHDVLGRLAFNGQWCRTQSI